MNKIILISGLKRSGKNYISNIMKNIMLDNGETVVEKSFAYYMKYILSTTMGVSMETFERLKNDNTIISDNTGEINTTARTMLQTFGSDVMYGLFGNTIWSDLAVKDLLKTVQSGTVIYTDFRHVHEYDAIINEFGDCVTIRIEDGRVALPTDHESERNLTDANFKFDYVIDNSAKNDSVITRVKEIIKEIENKTKTFDRIVKDGNYTVIDDDGEID